MRVAIHQPEFLPWLGFFDKMIRADLYIVLDNVQFSKNGFQNRNRLLDREGNTFWATVPVKSAGHTTRRIMDIEIDNSQCWQRKLWGRIHSSYCRHPFFPSLGPELELIIQQSHPSLIALNLELIFFFRRYLNITVPMVRASELDTVGNRSELLLSLCTQVGATTYLSGPSGRDYLNTKLFLSEGINIEFHRFTNPKQHQPGNLNVSCLDWLLNYGSASRSWLG